MRAGPVLVPAEASHDTVGRSLVLDLEHRALAGLIGSIEPLGDHPVEAGALEAIEPVPGGRAVAGRGCQVDRGFGAGQRDLEAGPALPLGHRSQILVVDRQQVPGDEARRRLGRQHADPRFGRVDAKQQGPEIERAVAGDDDLAIEHAALRERCAERCGKLRKVAVEGLEVARLRVEGLAVTEDQGTKAVPLRLEQPAVVRREAIDRLGQHRLDGRLEREVQVGHGRSVRGDRRVMAGSKAPCGRARGPGSMRTASGMRPPTGVPTGADEGAPGPRWLRGSAGEARRRP